MTGVQTCALPISSCILSPPVLEDIDIVDSTYADALILRTILFGDGDSMVSFDELLPSFLLSRMTSVATIRAGNPPFVKAFRISSVLAIALLYVKVTRFVVTATPTDRHWNERNIRRTAGTSLAQHTF